MMSFRKMVMPEDMNPANRLFGGKIMMWADEACAMYAICQLETSSLVTLKISEILFKNPAQNGDILGFRCSRKKVGTTSITVELNVYRKDLKTKYAEGIVYEPKDHILRCEFIFVCIDANGKPTAHGMVEDNGVLRRSSGAS